MQASAMRRSARNSQETVVATVLKHALAGSRAVKLFNINDGAVLRTIGYTASCLALMPDGLRFVSGGFDVACRAHIIEHGLAPVQYRG